MTITDPRGDPSVLQAVVDADHAHLAQLFEDARRDTSGTPGVHEQLLEQLRIALTKHLNTEAAVIHPEIRASLGDRDVAELARDTRDLRQLLDQPVVDLDWLGDVLPSHVDTVRALLVELRSTVGGKRLSALGFQYGRIAEAVPGRVAPTGAEPH
jgi:Hemerythrin HHE cation binding domain